MTDPYGGGRERPEVPVIEQPIPFVGQPSRDVDTMPITGADTVLLGAFALAAVVFGSILVWFRRTRGTS